MCRVYRAQPTGLFRAVAARFHVGFRAHLKTILCICVDILRAPTSQLHTGSPRDPHALSSGSNTLQLSLP